MMSNFSSAQRWGHRAQALWRFYMQTTVEIHQTAIFHARHPRPLRPASYFESCLISCPFHKEKTASRKIYKNSWYCFAVERAETSLTLSRKHEGIGFKDAFKALGVGLFRQGITPGAGHAAEIHRLNMKEGKGHISRPNTVSGSCYVHAFRSVKSISGAVVFQMIGALRRTTGRNWTRRRTPQKSVSEKEE